MDHASETGDAGGDDYSGPKSPLRVMQIVELLAASSSGLSLAAMTEALQIPKTSLLNHLRVMVAAGYVSSRDARYTLGAASLRLGAIIAADAGVLAAWRPVALDLVAQTGETAMLATLDDRSAEALYIDVVDSDQDIRYSPRVGSRWPLYCTGMGRALLAFQEPVFIDSYLASTRTVERTEITVTGVARLRRIIAGIRSAGVVVTQGEHTVGAGAVAAPIIERDGRVRCAIGIGVPIGRLGPRRDALIKLVADAARRVSWTLGGHGTSPVPLTTTVTTPPPHEARQRAARSSPMPRAAAPPRGHQ